jgi:hypothetical protein
MSTPGPSTGTTENETPTGHGVIQTKEKNGRKNNETQQLVQEDKKNTR